MTALTSPGKAALIFGASDTAWQIAEKVAASGTRAILVTEDRMDDIADTEALRSAASVSLLTDTRLTGCRGSIGDFSVELEQNGHTQVVDAAWLVLAEPDRRRANFESYGLAPGDTAVSLSELKARLADPAGAGWPSAAPRHLVFLHGIAAESLPVIAEEVMDAAIRLQKDWGVQTYLLVGNLKVAGDGLEALYRKCKEAGVFFVKFTDTAPIFRQEKDGAVVVEFVDEITHQRFTLRPDLTVVDEDVAPSKSLARMARILDLEVDESGFAQADNVHRWTVGTNRRGVLAVGPARGVMHDLEKRIDADNAAAVLDRIRQETPDDRARIEQGLCIRCLTCYRLCPYESVRITENERVEIMADACERCGICAAECPRTAIRIPGLGKDELVAEKARTSDAPVSITAFGCTRSSEPAGRLARRMGRAMPGGVSIIEVPCAGTVSLTHLMAAFSRGADGVMMLSCHRDNCHSTRGNRLARDRVELLRQRLAAIGVDPKRLFYGTLASNMGVEFAGMAEKLEKDLADLKPT